MQHPNIEIPQKVTNEWVDTILQTWKEKEREGRNSPEFRKVDMILRWALCGKDLSQYDLSGLDKEYFLWLTFNSSTIFPPADKMPAGISPEEILQRGKDPMLGIKKLHAQGIDGSGVKIAVFDSAWQSSDHQEYVGANIEVVDIVDSDPHFHADGVLANLCGRNIGVAPSASILHYSNSMGGGEKGNDARIECLQDVLKRVKGGDAIRAVNISAPLVFNNEVRSEEYEKAKEQMMPLILELEELGCEVIDAEKWGGDFSLCDFNHETGNIQPSNWRNSRSERIDMGEVAFVSGGKVRPETATEDGYKYERDASVSWTIPQVVGMYALTLQQNPNLTWSQFARICKTTSQMTESGVRVADPAGIIKQVKEMSTVDEQGNSYQNAISNPVIPREK